MVGGQDLVCRLLIAYATRPHSFAPPPKFFWIQNLVGRKNFWAKKSFWAKISYRVRGQPNRGYKKPNPNISSMIFGSYNRIRIVQKGIRFLINRIPNIGFLCSVYKKPNSLFQPNYSFERNITIL